MMSCEPVQVDLLYMESGILRPVSTGVVVASGLQFWQENYWHALNWLGLKQAQNKQLECHKASVSVEIC